MSSRSYLSHLSHLSYPALPLLVLVVLLAGCASTAERDARAARNRHYHLPWTAGERHRCIQPGPGWYSHHDAEEFAVDFSMEPDTPILASRAGRVIDVKQDSDRGGPSKRYAADGNYVRVLHGDGTSAFYLHLRFRGAAVRRGKRVRRGPFWSSGRRTFPGTSSRARPRLA